MNDFGDLPLFASGAKLRESGMQAAVGNADQANPGWSERALDCVQRFPDGGKEFLAEDVRAWAHKSEGLEEPPSKRAWGSVIVKARKLKIIHNAGFGKVKNPHAHQANAALWSRTPQS